jgi:hypothetical protein
MSEETKQIEFGKLSVGSKFYLTKAGLNQLRLHLQKSHPQKMM